MLSVQGPCSESCGSGGLRRCPCLSSRWATTQQGRYRAGPGISIWNALLAILEHHRVGCSPGRGSHWRRSPLQGGDVRGGAVAGPPGAASLGRGRDGVTSQGSPCGSKYEKDGGQARAPEKHETGQADLKAKPPLIHLQSVSTALGRLSNPLIKHSH